MDADVEAQDQQPNYNGDDQNGSDGCSATDTGNVSALIQPERTAARMPELPVQHIKQATRPRFCSDTGPRRMTDCK